MVYTDYDVVAWENDSQGLNSVGALLFCTGSSFVFTLSLFSSVIVRTDAVGFGPPPSPHRRSLMRMLGNSLGLRSSLGPQGHIGLVILAMHV